MGVGVADAVIKQGQGTILLFTDIGPTLPTGGHGEVLLLTPGKACDVVDEVR